MQLNKPLLLMILDGWGINPSAENNAVAAAKTPNLDYYAANYPSTELLCAGTAVGLPEGIMGNSEVGHMNIGAGRTVYQTLLRIDKAVDDGSFLTNRALTGAATQIRDNGASLHLMGLVSDGGVHSQLTHLFALIDLAALAGVKQTYIHVILDGRDTPPDSGAGFVERLQAYIADKTGVSIATVCGRFYAMDRDTRWERTQIAYNLYTKGEGKPVADPYQAVKGSYAAGDNDEFVKPIVCDARGIVRDNDAIIFFNFRADRARQITKAFTESSFDAFKREVMPSLSQFVCMAVYDETFDLPVAFGPEKLEKIMGEIISHQGLKQLRIAETEKYAHVTYFFNGGEETPFPNEDRCMVPSPREIETYDQKPEMSAAEVADKVIERINEEHYGFIVLNFANMDMVGHTGDFTAAIKAVESVDQCAKKVIDVFTKAGGAVIITADHGNSELMVDKNGTAHTAHTLNPVPMILVDDGPENRVLDKGCLGDIGPTALTMMGIDIPAEMTGKSLIRR